MIWHRQCVEVYKVGEAARTDAGGGHCHSLTVSRSPSVLSPSRSFLSLGLKVWSRRPSLPVPMADLGSFGMRRQPTAAEVVGRLKDDGDFDALRRAIVRKVKDNEVLRNNIITEVKQSMVLSEDGSEKMKLKELSDAIFQDVGSKIMGQISDEVWSVIQSGETDIRGSVEAVFNRIMNPQEQQDTGPSSKKLKRNGKGEQVSPAKAPAPVSVQVEDDEPEEPPGFGLSDLQRSSVIVKQEKPCDDGQNHTQVKPNGGELVGAGSLGDADDEDPDVPPGFG